MKSLSLCGTEDARSLKKTQQFWRCMEKKILHKVQCESFFLEYMGKKMSNTCFLFLPTHFASFLLVFLSWKLLHQNSLAFLWYQCFKYYILIICLVRDYSVSIDSLSGCELSVASFRRRWECEYLRTFFTDE